MTDRRTSRPAGHRGLRLISSPSAAAPLEPTAAVKKPPSPKNKKPSPPVSTPAAVPDVSPPTAAPPKKTKRVSAGLPIINAAIDAAAADLDDSALSASLPEPVLVLPDDERHKRVRQGQDSVLLDEILPDGRRRTRGFVRAVLRVPLSHPKARVYGVFIELDKEGYLAVRRAFTDKQEVRVWGRLATRLPFLDDAYGSDVCIAEDGSDRRARVVEVKAPSLIEGPQVGPRARRPS